MSQIFVKSKFNHDKNKFLTDEIKAVEKENEELKMQLNKSIAELERCYSEIKTLKSLLSEFEVQEKEKQQKIKQEQETKKFIEQLRREEQERFALEKMQAEKAEEEARKLQEQFDRERQEELANKRYDCPVCFDEFKIEEMYTLDECAHRFCFDCLKGHFHTNISDHNIKIKCPEPECKHYVTEFEVQHISTFEDLEKFREYQLKNTLETMPDFRYCPQTDCPGAMIKGDNNRMNCPVCNFEFCFECNEPYHDNFSCEDYQRWKVENATGDIQFDNWAMNNAKKCPSCRADIQKNGGCNKMTCVKCKC